MSLPIDARLYGFRNYQSVFPMPDWGSLSQWKKEREKIRKHLWLCTGMNADTRKFRPKAKVVSKFEHEGLVIENIRIETLPGLFVMGNLYRPKVVKGRLPVVLHPHGHGMRSRTVSRSPMFSVPHRAMNTALNGMIAFAWSMTAHDEDCMQIEHRILLEGKDKELCNLMGLSMFGLQVHNGIKILDYLLGRKDVDAKRVGCTGESGGATQTYYMAALDDRITVTAPCVMLSGHYQGGCVCENAPNLHLDYSTVHYAALIAPRPLLLTGCTGDWTHHAREREFKSMRELYGLYGKPDAVDLFYQDEAHNFNTRSRERVYAWLRQWLLKDSKVGKRVAEAKVPVPDPEKLLVHDTPVPPVKGVIRTQLALTEMWQRFHAKPETAEDTLAALQLRAPDKADLLVRNRIPRYRSKGKTLSDNRMDYGRFSDDSGLSCRFVLPEKGKPCTLVLGGWKNEEAWRRFVARPPVGVQKAIERGEGIVVPLLFGQRSPDAVKSYRAAIEESYLFTSYNRTPHAHQAGDIVTTVLLAGLEMGVPTERISIVADRNVALVGLVAWAALCAQSKIGPFAGNFRGIDPQNPQHWARHAYLPLILRGNGMESLAKLIGRRKGVALGVERGMKSAFPAGFRTSGKSVSVDMLIGMAGKGR